MPLAQSLERAVNDAAIFLLAAGAVLALAGGLIYGRWKLVARITLVCALLALGAGTAFGARLATCDFTRCFGMRVSNGMNNVWCSPTGTPPELTR